MDYFIMKNVLPINGKNKTKKGNRFSNSLDYFDYNLIMDLQV